MNKLIYTLLLILILFLGLNMATMKGQLNALEELEVVYLDVACANPDVFKGAIYKRASEFKVLEREDFTVENLEQAILSKCKIKESK